MTDLPADHQIGANQPPVDEFTARLEASNEELLDLEADFELLAGKLPGAVTSDEEVGAITAWVTRMRALARDVENRRVEVKAPYLEREKQIDGWFGKFRKRVLDKAQAVEQRSTAYLAAKRAREAAEARARAEAAAEERRRAQAQAAEARRREEAAEAARRQAEEDVRETARRSAAEAEEAETRLREATARQAAASKAVEGADKDVRTTGLAEERAERRAENPGQLGKAAGGGGAAKVTMVPGHRIANPTLLYRSLGPLYAYFSEETIGAALYKWAKAAKDRPDLREAIPGVEYFETAATKTTATRGERN